MAQQEVEAVTVEQLWAMLSLAPEEDVASGEVFLVAPDQSAPADRVFGGLLLAQGVMAAAHGLDVGFLPLVMQADFLQGVPVSGRNRWRVTTLASARSLVSRRAALIGDDGAELFAATVRLGLVRDDLDSASASVPRAVAGPDGLPDLETYFAGDESVPAWWRIPRPVQLRQVRRPVFLEPAPERSSEQTLWWRAREDVVGDPVRSAAVIAYTSDMSLLEPAYRLTGTARHAEGSRILSLTHTLVLHEHPDLTGWLQMDCSVERIARGRALGAGEVYVGDAHVASVSQVALVKLGGPARP